MKSAIVNTMPTTKMRGSVTAIVTTKIRILVTTVVTTKIRDSLKPRAQ